LLIQAIDEAKLAIASGASVIGLVSEMPSGPGVISDGLIENIAIPIGAPRCMALIIISSAYYYFPFAYHKWSCLF